MSKLEKPNSYREGPNERGRFGIYGGRFVPETLMPLILALEKAYAAAKADPSFKAELDNLLKHYVGRPSPLYFAERLTEKLGGAKVYFKRDELNHTGAHKINNVLGQILLARRMGKKRIIAETGAGQHGVATATACARFGLTCVVYMGEVDVERQKPNVFRMKMLGAEVRPVHSGARTLKDAMNEALRDWVTNVADTYYCIGTAAGPHPYPAMVRDFQCVIGEETRAQMLELEGRLPDSLVACIGGGSNAIGLFHPFLDEPGVEMFGVEAAGHGLDVLNGHAASINGGRPGVLHGNRTYLLMNDDGQILEGHSISAGLDYPGVGPEHSWLNDVGRVTYLAATDKEALAAFQLCSRLEGIIPALEPAHALAKVIELAPKRPKDHLMVMNLCGRGDKDIFAVADHLGRDVGRGRLVALRRSRQCELIGRAIGASFAFRGRADGRGSRARREAQRLHLLQPRRSRVRGPASRVPLARLRGHHRPREHHPRRGLEAALGLLIRDADTIVFVLSPSSASSPICVWEVEEAVSLGKRIFPVLCRPLGDVTPPPKLVARNYTYFYSEPTVPGSGFGTGLARLVDALNTDPDWMREHARYLRLAKEWEEVGRPPGRRLLSAADIALAKEWIASPEKRAGADRFATRFHRGERGRG